MIPTITSEQIKAEPRIQEGENILNMSNIHSRFITSTTTRRGVRENGVWRRRIKEQRILRLKEKGSIEIVVIKLLVIGPQKEYIRLIGGGDSGEIGVTLTIPHHWVYNLITNQHRILLRQH